MTQMNLQQALDAASRFFEAGRPADAETLYRQVLAHQPNHPEAIHMLGLLAYQAGRYDVAIELIRRSIALNPSVPEFHGNLGLTLAAANRAEEAIGTSHRALALRPNYPEAHNNLANAFLSAGKMDEALRHFRQAISLSPDYPDAHNNLGNLHHDLGRLDEAIDCYRRAIALRPSYVDAHYNLANSLQASGRPIEAIAAFRRALDLRPNYLEALNNLGNVLLGQGETDEAMAAFNKVIAISPNFAEAYSNLSNAFKDKDLIEQAIAACQRALQLRPNYPEAQSNLGNVLKDIGLIDEAIACYSRAMELNPRYTGVHSNRVYTLYFHPGHDAVSIQQDLREWNRRHAQPLRQFIQPHDNDPSPDRRLRIGYVSPDFRQHVVGWNLLPLLRRHDHAQFEIVCYSGVSRADEMTRQIQACADIWRNTLNAEDEKIARMIRDDRVDILVDLSLHSAGNRLRVFARKPAPVQVTYLGYCGSTGLDTIDYRFSDPYLDPPDSDCSVYSEQTIRLPSTYWCYQPGGPTPEVSSLPAIAAGFITFGCLNNFAKVSAALDLWTKLLGVVPRSRLLLHCPEGAHRQSVLQRFAAAGIAPERIELTARKHWPQYIPAYHRLDIVLDPFPYGGGITSCDALWMGVPLVTLVGRTAPGRAGASILSNLGLSELIANSPEEYLRIAAGLAADIPRLTELRCTLRPRMQASPLMDEKRFAQDVESAYRSIWNKWCEDRKP